MTKKSSSRPQKSTMKSFLFRSSDYQINSSHNTNGICSPCYSIICKCSENYIILYYIISCEPCFQECDIFNKLMPALQNCLQTGCAKTRELACFNIARYSYYLTESHRRLEILMLMSEGCLQSSSYQMRMNYIYFVVGIAQHCSRKFFILNKFIRVLELSNDRVLDVKMTLARNLYQLRVALEDTDEQSLQQYKTAVLKLLSNKKKILIDLVKKSEETVFRYNSNMQEIKDKINEKDYLREVMEEKRMSQELKTLRAEEAPMDLSEPIPLSPFLLNFIKKYKKRHSVMGNKVIATGAAANASLTQKISQNVNKKNQKLDSQKKQQQQQVTRSRRKSVALGPADNSESNKKSSLPHSEHLVNGGGMSSERTSLRQTPKMPSQFKPKKNIVPLIPQHQNLNKTKKK